MEFLRRLNPFATNEWPKELREVTPEADFRLALQRERARADRSGHCFSLVAFEVGNPRSEGSPARHLARVLDRRLRSTDHVGWLDKRRVATFLYTSSVAGALHFGNSICEDVAEFTSALTRFTVYTYPGLPQPDGAPSPSPRRGDRNDGSGEWTPEPVAVGGPSAGDEEPGIVDTEWEAQRSLADSSFLPTTITAEYGNRPGLALHPILITPMPVSKRIFDAVGSAVGLLLLSPLFVCVAAFIKIVSPGPVFFKQERVGHLGTTFTMWKFRTMQVGSDTSAHKNHVKDLLESDEPMQKLDDHDPQIIPGGRFLRKTAIDEFPQLFNVLMGDMSLVGPRPDVPYAVEGYQRWFNARHDVLPGMTGLWQVSGKNKTSYTEMMRFDATYSRQTSLKNDMKILLHTGPAILSQVREKSAAKKTSSGDDKDANGSGPTASS